MGGNWRPGFLEPGHSDAITLGCTLPFPLTAVWRAHDWGSNSTSLRQGDSGFTDIGGLGIQSGFPRCYSPWLLFLSYNWEGHVTFMAVVQVQYSTVCLCVCLCLPVIHVFPLRFFLWEVTNSQNFMYIWVCGGGKKKRLLGKKTATVSRVV